MRIESLRTFVSLVRAGSYSATADELFMSPTTIHGQIRALEQELGTPLVAFQGRDLHLTVAGRRLLMFAERTIEERLRLDADISGVTQPPATKLRVSSLHGPSIHLLPPVIRAYREVRPDVVVSVGTVDIGGGIAALESGHSEILILNDLHADEVGGGFAVTSVYDDTLCLIIRADDYCPPDLALLTKYPVASQSVSSAYRKHFEQWARTNGVEVEVVFEHSSFDGLLSFVMQGKCIGMVAGYVAKMSPMADRLRVLEVPGFDLTRRVVAAHAIRPDSIASDFLAFLQTFYLPSGSPESEYPTRFS